ncbi:Bug family tripartite tricarboxylate transporter substrate binding protein [Roseococcus sp.]|uniref:Bug family tripartite tricarboxylate transporter substrate binding protein n=1 Tax=Roseococcus sp. TaxID=2109646 RepID=UPI003BA9FB1F
MFQRRGLLAAPFVLGAAPVLAQTAVYPQRAVRVVVPWPPGQATDLAARIVMQRLAETMGQPFVAENRAGAGGMIGTDLVAKAPPDGYTLLAGSTGPIVTSPLVQRMPYDSEKDFTWLGITGLSSYVLVVPPNFPARTAEEFVALVRANPGKYSFSSSGTGATAHVIAAWFHALAQLDVVHVPFAGSGPALAAVAGGHVNFSVETLAGTGPLIRSGSLRALGISLKNGSELAADIPPLARLPGCGDFDAGAWIGLMGPANMPAPVVQQLDAAIGSAMREPEMRQRMATAGLEPQHHGSAAMAQYAATQRAAFREAIRRANIRIDG